MTRKRSATSPRPPAEDQDLTTDPRLIRAIQQRWGSLHIDLAAKDGQEVTPWHITPAEDSLATPWPIYTMGKWPIRAFLNPPFSPDITPWAAKCALWVEQAVPGSLLFFLTPASIDSEWWRDHVRGIARPLALKTRPRFGGIEWGYPRPVTLSIYDTNFPEQAPTIELWDWLAELQ